MTMKSNKRKRMDYYPLIGLFLFWFIGAFAGSLQISEAEGNMGHTLLGLITLPSLVLIAMAFKKVRELHKEITDDQTQP